MEGFLKIKETFWNPYYFILTNDCLAYCKRKGEPIIGRFHLKISSMKSLPNKPLNIQLNNGFSEILLEAEDVREKMKWISSFENRQEELLKYDAQEIYYLHNLEDVILKDNTISEEVKENLENKFVNSLAELWNLQASIDENLDNLSSVIKDTFIINVLKKIEYSVANIKKIITNYSNIIKEEKLKIYKLYRALASTREQRYDFQKQATPAKYKKNSSFYVQTLDNDNRFLHADIRKSFSQKHDYHQLNNMSMDKYLKYQEKIEENNTESYKDFQNSMYNDISYEKMETGVNPLELQNAQFSNFSDDKTKTTLENIKDRLPKKYSFLKNNPLFGKFNFIEEQKRSSLPFFRMQKAKFNMGSIFQIHPVAKNQNNLAIYTLEPLTDLQRNCEQFENVSYLIEATNKEIDPCLKMAYVIAFCVNTLAGMKNRYNFPFSGVLGETFELDYDEPQAHFKYLAEQISIQPNTFAYNCKSQNFEVWGTVIKEIEFWGKSIEIEPKGITHIKLNNDNNFIFSNAYKMKITNLECETPKIEIEGDITFQNLETKDMGEISFRKESLSSTNYNFIGSIKNSKGENKFKLFGIWNSTFILQNVKTKKTIELLKKQNAHENEFNNDDPCFFSPFSLNLNALNFDLIEKLPLSDSRFRSDVKALEFGEIKFANEEKNRIEGKQRERAFTYKPVFFEEVLDSFHKNPEFVVKGNYWKMRDENTLSEESEALF